MSENMVERMARAIHFRGEDGGDDAWFHCQPYLREMARGQARAAIEAMRDLTDDMSRAAYDTPRQTAEIGGPKISRLLTFKAQWAAAIDVALAPIEQTTER